MDEKIIIQALLLLKGVNRKSVWKLITTVDTIETAPKPLMAQLEYAVGKITTDNADILQRKLDESYQLMKKSEKENLKTMCISDNNFPMNLKIINDPPVLIYVKGELEPFLKGINIAIIGTREPTVHGIKVAERLGIQFSQRGCNVISGLAAGCDALSHKGCLSVGGKALAVLPAGIDKITPKSNNYLANQIVEKGGALISEYPLGCRAFKGNYVDRDRLESGLSQAVVVVETDLKGGTMHTVKFAQDENRLLACYKHPSKYLSEEKTRGNSKLIDDGIATPIASEEDIISLIKLAQIKKSEIERKFSEMHNMAEKQLNFI